MRHIHTLLPDEYNSIKQVEYNGTVYINDNYKFTDEETETICFQLKNQQASQASRD